MPCPYQRICIIIKVKLYNDEPLLNSWRGYALSVRVASRREVMPQALRDASRSKIPVGVCVYTNTGLTFLLFFWCQIAIASQILEVRNQYGLDNKSEGEDKGDEERSLSAGFRRHR